MSFYLLFLCGIAGGVLGGMGMGGGTALIPLLTLLCGAEQTAAQGINLLAFLPMSAISLSVHAKNGLLRRDGLAFLAVPAMMFSAGGALLAAFLPPSVLRRGFGAFLAALALFRLRGEIPRPRGKETEKISPKADFFRKRV